MEDVLSSKSPSKGLCITVPKWLIRDSATRSLSTGLSSSLDIDVMVTSGSPQGMIAFKNREIIVDVQSKAMIAYPAPYGYAY